MGVMCQCGTAASSAELVGDTSRSTAERKSTMQPSPKPSSLAEPAASRLVSSPERIRRPSRIRPAPAFIPPRSRRLCAPATPPLFKKSVIKIFQIARQSCSIIYSNASRLPQSATPKPNTGDKPMPSTTRQFAPGGTDRHQVNAGVLPGPPRTHRAPFRPGCFKGLIAKAASKAIALRIVRSGRCFQWSPKHSASDRAVPGCVLIEGSN